MAMLISMMVNGKMIKEMEKVNSQFILGVYESIHGEKYDGDWVNDEKCGRGLS